MKAHCDEGAWVGGEWVDIEHCTTRFVCKNMNVSGRNCSPADCKKCPRARSRNSAAKADGSYDVVIIGAGCIGACVARALAKTGCKTLLLDAADDVSQGATKGNSGIVHAGFDDKPGSVRSKFCNKGCLMFPALDEELHFGYQRNGSLVVAMNNEEEKVLDTLLKQGAVNGVKNLRIIDQKALRALEPDINPKATKALLAEDAGTLVPYEFCIAVVENAVDNGVELRLQREVTGIQRNADGSFAITATHWDNAPLTVPAAPLPLVKLVVVAVLALVGAAAAYQLISNKDLPQEQLAVYCIVAAAASMAFGILCSSMGLGGTPLPASKASTASKRLHSFSPSKGTVFQGTRQLELIQAGFVVNCAGTKSDAIARLLGDDSFTINERLGDYVLLHKNQGKKVGRTLFPCPGPMGKGVLVQNTLWGNLILGPTARDTMRKDPVTGKYVINEATRDETNESIIKTILTKCRELVPSFDASQVIHTFCGGRAKSSRGDWIIEPVPNCPRAIHAAGIDSPGLAGSPAIAIEVVRLLGAAGAPVASSNPNFNKLRAPIVTPKKGWKNHEGQTIKCSKEPGQVSDPMLNVVCKCEKVTEAEVIDACRRSIPIYSTQAIRKRTRCGMGHCQGDPKNYDCEARVAAIIAREQGVSVDSISRRPWPASSLMPNRFFTDADKKWVQSLSE